MRDVFATSLLARDEEEAVLKIAGVRYFVI